MIGEYPCCEGPLAVAMPDKTPAYRPEECPHCGAKVWHRLSRVEPLSWTEEGFLKEYAVDWDTRTVKALPGSDAEAFDKFNRDHEVHAAFDAIFGLRK